MKLSFTPMRRDDLLGLTVTADILTINDEAFDFGFIREEDLLPQDAVGCAWLASDVIRIDGEIHLTLILPHGPTAPQETRFPQSIIASDGGVPLPPHSLPKSPELDPAT